MSEHTPGPWHLAPSGWVHDLKGRLIAEPVTDEAEPQEDNEVAANARLIAAAPDLLTACRELLDFAIDPAQNSHDVANFIEAGRAAIARATGGE